MRPLPRRLPSKSATWALRIALFVPVLAVLSIFAHRGGTVDTPTFLVLLVIIAIIALISLLFAFLAFRSMWRYGKRGGRRATWALFICAVILGPYLYGAALWVSRPHQIEVSTDVADPPVFQTEITEFTDRASTVVASRLKDGYPEITGRRFSATPDIVMDEVLGFAESQGWKVANRRGRVGADDELVVEFGYKTMVLSMPVGILVRVKDEGETTYLDMRSKSYFAEHDLGSNARLITGLLSTLDFNLFGQLEK